MGNDVWEAMLSESGDVTGAAGDPEDPSPPNAAMMGGYKRPRAAVSLSSVGSDHLPAWTHRLQEAAVMLHRSAVS